MLEILYKDEYLVAINKPHGLIVHPSKIAIDAAESAMVLLRDQLDQYVYPVHRIDRKTSGVLLFALDKEAQKVLNKQFKEGGVKKKYLAIVRGYLEKSGEINYSLVNDRGKNQDAQTRFECLEKTSIDVPLNGHPTSRYSLAALYPITGRQHQLRKHMAHIFHPIIGDRPHGCNKQNRMFKERFGMTKMMLHAQELQFLHPLNGKSIRIEARISEDFERIWKLLWI